MAAIVLTSNPQVITPGDTQQHWIELPEPDDRKFLNRRGEKIISVVITSGSFKVNTEGDITSDSATLASGTTYPAFTSNAKKRVLYLQDQTGSSSMIVSIL